MMKHIEKMIIIMLLILNLGTLLFVKPLSQNLSDFGNALGHRAYLILLAVSASAYFFIYTSKLMKLTHYTCQLGKIILYVTSVGMVVSVLLPFAPYQYPNLSKWHTRIALLSSIAYLILFFHFLFEAMKKDYSFFYNIIKQYINLVFIDSFLYLVNGGVSALLEVSYSIGMILLLPYTLHTYKKRMHGQ